MDTALITGASAGLGTDFARQLSPRCRHLILVARRLDRLESLQAELLVLHPGLRIDCRQVDLQQSAEVESLLQWLREGNLPIDCLVNNAGLGDVGDLASAEWTRIFPMLEVNMVALTRLTYALLPAMVARRKGKIINVGSIAGYLAIPGFAVYAATKAYVNSFSEALHWELQGTGVTVTAVCPGPVSTEFLQVASRGKGRKAFDSPKFVEVSSPEVVRQSLRAALAGKPRTTPGFFIWFGAQLLDILPLWWMRLLYRFKVISAP